jgi:hypothetical protein
MRVENEPLSGRFKWSAYAMAVIIGPPISLAATWLVGGSPATGIYVSIMLPTIFVINFDEFMLRMPGRP